MFTFRMSKKDNFASFHDPDTGRFVLVDSFDDREFNVRIGTLSESQLLGVITADSDEMLNKILREFILHRV